MSRSPRGKVGMLIPPIIPDPRDSRGRRDRRVSRGETRVKKVWVPNIMLYEVAFATLLLSNPG